MRILIIGGTGFSGPYIVRQLAELGHELLLLHRGRTEADLPVAVRQLQGDREQLTGHAAELTGFAPEIVLDMIPLHERQARQVMELFTGVARRVIAISSQDVYRAYGVLNRSEPGPPDPVPLTEEAPLRSKLYPYRQRLEPGHRLYDYDKIPVERAFLGSSELPGTILRYPMVYGPRDAQHRLYPYLKRMSDERPAILLEQGMANWRWTRGYVENAAAAVVLAVTREQAAGRIYNIGEAAPLTEAEWVRAIGKAAGWSGRIVTLPSDRLPEQLAAGINTAQDLVTDVSRIRTELGYIEPVAPDEALRRTVAWELAHPPAEIAAMAFDYEVEDRILRELEESRE